MKIISVHVVAFGKIKDEHITFHDGLNVVQNANGFGKTTLACFIRAMLYGFTYTRTKGVTDVSRFAPWGSTEKFGGSMVVEHNGETYRIERFFGATAKSESTRFTNEKTGKTVSFDGQPGEYLLGLTADSYDRSAYFPQEAVELSSNDNFDTRLANLVQDGAEDYDRIQDKLRAYKKNLKYERGNGGKIKQLDDDLQHLQAQLRDANNAERRSKEIDKRLISITQEKATWEQRYSQCQEQLTNLQTPQVENKQQPQQQPKQHRKLGILAYILSTIFDVAGIVLIVLGLVGVCSKPVGLFVGGAICVIGVTVTCISYYGRRSSNLQPSGTEQSVVSNQEEMKNRHLATMKNCVQALNNLATETGQLEEERKNLVFDSVAIQDKILAVDEERAEALHKYEVADAVSKLLEQAKDNLSMSYLPKLCTRTSQLLSEITQNDLSVTVSRDFAINIRQNGLTKPMNQFSRGIREITLLCFRGALSELLYDGAIPFVIIDDAFVNFDEDNFVRATALLKRLSTHAQVVYLTCHNRTGQLLK